MCQIHFARLDMCIGVDNSRRMYPERVINWIHFDTFGVLMQQLLLSESDFAK